ncbi:MAG: FGGY-family carbohydrate kinase [Treponema sp.]|jgi:sugar (pentulose or hexulose) kinase|nr:FGGY-family carbohydrate kinase [Treponema sp.]
MTEPLILTFDIGTQSTRALLVNARGDILHKVQKPYDPPYFSQNPGWAEQRADYYWGCIGETSRSLKEKAGDLWKDIIAVTCSTIRDTVVCLDRNRNPLGNVILWLDERKADKIPPVSAFANSLYRLVGMKEGVAIQRAGSHCNWLAYHDRERWDKTEKYVFISAWLNYKFTGNLVDSTASAIGHLPFDSKTRNWYKNRDFRWAIFYVTKGKLCDLVEPGTVTGGITAETSEHTGIPKGLPLIATGSDKGCETLGLSCLDNGKAALSFGTTATVQLSSQKYFEPQPFMPSYAAVVPGYFNPEIEIYRGYWLLNWFKREFAAKEMEEAAKLGLNAEKLLDNRLKEIPPGCDGLIMQPYFTPGVNMPFAKGAIIGFSDIHTRIHIYRAIIEGINFALMDGLHYMEKRGNMQIKSLFAAGGGAQSDEICRITASMFGLPVYRIQTHEATGIGSSLAAFVAKGVFSSYEEGIGKMVHIKDEFEPKPQEHQIYEQLYSEVFTKVFDKLSPLYEVISGIVAKKFT